MFGRRITLFKLFGFQVRVDASWLILAILITWSLAAGFFPERYHDLSAFTYGCMGFAGALGLFASIIFHEMTHSLVARRFGLPIRGITLFIFGGVAEMEEEPSSARAEFFMAVAGPLASLFLGGLFYLLYAGIGRAWFLPVFGVLTYLSWINFILAGFNLVPAFPLDGGRVLRAVLWRWKKNLKWATHVSSQIGSGFGFLLMFWGMFAFFMGNFIGGLWYFLIGLFLQNASLASYRKLLIAKTFEGEKVRRFMRPDPITVSPALSLAEFVENYIYKYHYKMFPVTEGERLIGCVSTQEVKEVPPDEWQTARIADIVNESSCKNTLTADTDVTKALSIMSQTGKSRMMVAEDGRLIGVITLKDLLKFLSLKLDLEKENT